jgi:hypothetical protein
VDREVGISGVDGNCLVFKEIFSAKLLTCKSKKMTTISHYKIFEKCLFVFEFKEDENCNHLCTLYRSWEAGRNTLAILRIKPPKFGVVLKFGTLSLG